MPDEEKLSPDELEELEGELLPAREQMSVISGGDLLDPGLSLPIEPLDQE